MNKLPVFQPHSNFIVEVSVCSILPFFRLKPFGIVLTAEVESKIDTVLSNTTSSQFIVFPEYCYTEGLREKYQTHSDANNSVIIAGSGLEEIGNNYYAFCPIFVPNREPIKIYKKHITLNERMLSNGRILPYPDDVQREIPVEYQNRIVMISVYICYDFLVEAPQNRTDITFVPQFENEPGQFISRASELSKGDLNFVFGANCIGATDNGNNRRSLGFAVLNNAGVNNLSVLNWRNSNYQDANGNHLTHHMSVVYDQAEESIITFNANVGIPYSMQFNFRYQDVEPVVVPKEIILL